MQLVFSTQNKLVNMLGGTKDKTIKEQKSGIYEITCECGAKYYGQSRRQVRIRYKEHLAAIRLNQPSKSAVALHSLENLHFNFTNDSVVVKKCINNPSLLDAYESYYIHKHNQRFPHTTLMNTDHGNISSCLFNCV